MRNAPLERFAQGSWRPSGSGGRFDPEFLRARFAGVTETVDKLRRRGLAARRCLSSRERRRASRAACRRLARHAVVARAKRIGAYRALASEADPIELRSLLRADQTLYWPRVSGSTLVFVGDHTPALRFADSGLGMTEPVNGRGRQAASLDLIIMPLAAFDASGNRVGMGGGYYDRTLAATARERGWRRPTLIGLAFEAQRVAMIPARKWDVPVDWIATEAGIYRRCALAG